MITKRIYGDLFVVHLSGFESCFMSLCHSSKIYTLEKLFFGGDEEWFVWGFESQGRRDDKMIRCFEQLLLTLTKCVGAFRCGWVFSSSIICRHKVLLENCVERGTFTSRMTETERADKEGRERTVKKVPAAQSVDCCSVKSYDMSDVLSLSSHIVVCDLLQWHR